MPSTAGTGGPHGEADVLDHGQLVVEGGGMAEHPHLAAQRPAPSRRRSWPSTTRLAAGDGQQAGAGPQHARLARPVGPFEDDHLARGDGEVDAGQGREPPGESDSGTEEDGGGHGLRPMLRGARPRNPSGAAAARRTGAPSGASVLS